MLTSISQLTSLLRTHALVIGDLSMIVFLFSARILGEAAEEIAEETWYEISKRSFLIISFLIIVFGGTCFLAVSEIFLFA